MDKFKRKGDLTLSISFVVLIITIIYSASNASTIVANGGSKNDLIWKALESLNLGLLVLCCYYYSKSKGYSGWYATLGFLYYLGVVILFFLPKSTKK